jgi:parvulin-like peptidyl-prolyl isomerase
MRVIHYCSLALLLGLGISGAAAQAPGNSAAPATVAAPTMPVGEAAIVNGQQIPEVAVQRGLKRLPAETQAKARAEILNYLIDNLLLDQYLVQLPVEVPRNDVDARLAQVRDEIKKESQSVEKVMQELMLTEEELRAQLTAEIRWEKYADVQATEKVLRDFFDKNPEMFDGTMVRGRHILLTPTSKEPAVAEQVKLRLLQLKKQIEDQVAGELAKLPATADQATRNKERARCLDEAFAAIAGKESACPSKVQGGDLGWFPRVGSMLEPFAKAAFALKPQEMSDVIGTQFGYHLILVTDRRPGKETKFDDVREVVKEVYCDRLRESLCDQLKPRARIVINPSPKP